MNNLLLILGTVVGLALYFLCEYNRRHSFAYLLEEAGRVSKAMFPSSGVKEHMLKLKKEADEVIANPSSIEEHSDCLLVILSSASKAGIYPDDLLKSSRKKLKQLETRKWIQEEDGTYQHVSNPYRPL